MCLCVCVCVCVCQKEWVNFNFQGMLIGHNLIKTITDFGDIATVFHKNIFSPDIFAPIQN